MRLRAAPRAFAILAAGLALLATQGAHAAGFVLPAGRSAEAALTPGSEGAFDVPVVVEEDGLLYAKVLPTPGNAAHDGWRANASWRVGFHLVRVDGASEDLGGSVEGDASRLAPVRAGEAVTLRVLVQPPADALALGGPQQRVHVALAWRPATATATGGASGGTLDSARALTLHVRLDGGAAIPAPPSGAEGTAGQPDTDPGPVQLIPDARTPTPAGGGAAAASVPFVPVWALAWGLVLLGGILLALVAVAVLLALLLRETRASRAAAGGSRAVPVRLQAAPQRDAPSAADERPHRPERRP